VQPFLLTGFERFGELRVNPSALVVEDILRRLARGVSDSRPSLVGEILKTEFQAAESRIRGLIRAHRPETVIAVGVAPRATGMRLERVAANVDDARLPDNAGYQPNGVPIVADGSPTLIATLPLERMLDGILDLGIPASISDDAGRYVCNHVMYSALDEIRRGGFGTRCGFIHVPLCSDLEAGPECPSNVTLAQLIAAVERCVAIALAAGSHAAPLGGVLPHSSGGSGDTS
jgi:pyroglutamyl-peptidase